MSREWGPISPNGYQYEDPANDVPFWENEALPTELDIDITATVNNTTGTPRVEVTKEKEGQEYNFNLDFYNLKGERGEVGPCPNVAAAATVDANVGVPDVDVETTGSLENPTFIFDFKNLKGETGAQGPQGIKGDTGDPGATGPQGPQGVQGPAGHSPVVSASATVDGTSGTPGVTVFNNGTVEDPNFRFAFTGLKGEEGETGETPNITATASVTSSGSLGVTVTKTGTAEAPNFDFAFTGFKSGGGGNCVLAGYYEKNVSITFPTHSAYETLTGTISVSELTDGDFVGTEQGYKFLCTSSRNQFLVLQANTSLGTVECFPDANGNIRYYYTEGPSTGVFTVSYNFKLFVYRLTGEPYSLIIGNNASWTSIATGTENTRYMRCAGLLSLSGRWFSGSFIAPPPYGSSGFMIPDLSYFEPYITQYDGKLFLNDNSAQAYSEFISYYLGFKPNQGTISIPNSSPASLKRQTAVECYFTYNPEI